MATHGICLQLTHIGTQQIYLSDVHDGVDALNSRHVRRKPGPLYMNPGDVILLVYTSYVAASFEAGAIRHWIDEGVLTHVFVTGPTYPTGSPLPPLAGVVGATLAEGPVGTLTFRQLLESEILPDWAITGFSPNTSVVEVSDTIATPGFTASYIRTPPTSALLDDSEGTPQKNVTATPVAFNSDGNFQKTSINASVTFTLTATDPLTGNSANRNTSISWQPRTHWGVGVDGLSTEADIKALASSALDNNRNRTFTVNPGAGEHIYYAYPASYGAATFTVGGFVGGFVLVSAAISVTNAYGFTTNYRLYKSVAANLGSTTVVVT